MKVAAISPELFQALSSIFPTWCLWHADRCFIQYRPVQSC